MIQLENICKQYTNHNHTVRAVDDVSFSVAENERVGIAGGSGSGKSTLLRISLYADDVPKSLGSNSTEDELRSISLGAVYQLWAYGYSRCKGRYQ